MRLIAIVLFSLAVACEIRPAWSSPPKSKLKLTKIGDSTVDSHALTIEGPFNRSINGKSFQQDAIVSHAGYQYLGYYDAQRRVCLARRQLPDGKWSTLRFEDYEFKSNDAHNTISLGVCPLDGTIHMAFDHHGHPLHYRVSQKHLASQPETAEWDVKSFGPIKSELEMGKPIAITYPRFWQTPDGALQFCYRRGGSGNGDRMLVDYDPESGSWKNTRQIDSGDGQYGDSTSRCSYPNGYTYGPNGYLHTTWVWREGPGTANHDLMYVFSKDQGRTWRTNSGKVLQQPAAVDTPGVTVWEIPVEYGLMNTHGQTVDSQGRLHVVMWHCSNTSLEEAGAEPGQSRWGPEEAERYQHYWRDANGEWHHQELPWTAGGRPKIFADANDNLYLIYNADKNLEIAGATAASGWTDWGVVHVEKGPFVNEMLADPYRWKDEAVLSILVQGDPPTAHAPTELRVVDFQ